MARLLIFAGVLIVALSSAIAWTFADTETSNAPVAAPLEEIGTTEPAPDPTATPALAPEPAEAPPPPPPSPPNRLSCTAIRGTDYLSLDERNWFRSNCTR
jgi:hypothetical protein